MAVGKSLHRLDAVGKATGATRYGGDLVRDGMLYAMVLRSAHASAGILNIDTGNARTRAGVVAVYTARDVPGTNRHGLIARDTPVLADGHVRYMGDAVALVVAQTEAAARAALDDIRVEYRPLPSIHSIDDALAAGAHAIHPYGNVMGEKKIRRGDADEAFESQCDVIVEETFETQTVDHAFLDLEAGTAVFDGDVLTIEASGQWVHEERRLCALALGMPVEKVRIIQPPTGGAFGGREDISIQIYIGLAALGNPGRHIYLRYDRAESMAARHKRHAIRCHYKLGARRDGSLVAAKVRIHSDEGAYASTGIAVMRKASSHSTGPYRVPNVEVDVIGVHTNNNPTGAMRGFGAAQMAIAYEGMMDRLAGRLGMDRVELRARNLLRSGEAVTTTQIVPVVTANECLAAVLRQFAHGTGVADPGEPPPITDDLMAAWRARSYETGRPWMRRGYGVSVICFGLGYGDGFPDASRARVRFNDANQLEVFSGAVDFGQGLLNMIVQVAAEEMGVDHAAVHPTCADTGITPEAGSSSATRQTYFTGSAVKLACGELRERLFDVASAMLGLHPHEIRCVSGVLQNCRDAAHSVPLADVLAEARRRQVCLEAAAIFKPPTIRENLDTGLTPRAFVTYLFGSHLAQVLVDTETGEVRVERYIACHDVGRAINPQSVDGQIQGGVAQGIGMALMEEVIYNRQGRIANPGFTDYIIPTVRDMPAIESVILEVHDPSGPFGAHGVGEPPLIGTPPAILGAIADAIGKPVSVTPATAERVWRLLHTDSRRQAS